MLRFIGLIMAFLFVVPGAYADWDRWKNARALYDAGDFKGALSTIQSNPASDAAYFYNVGNIYYRLGEYGKSVANLEKASLLRPRNGDIQHNLELSRSALSERLGGRELDPASTTIQKYADRFSLEGIRGGLGLLLFLMVGLWAYAYSTTRSVTSLISTGAGLAGSCGIVLCVVLYLFQSSSGSQPPVVVYEPTVVRSGPGDHFLELARMQAGIKLRRDGGSAQDSAGGEWTSVRYSSGGIGWVSLKDLFLL